MVRTQRAVGGGWARGRRPPSRGSRLSSMAVLKVQQPVGLFAAPLNSDVKKLLYEHLRVVLEAAPQHLGQEIFKQPKEAQGKHNKVLHYGYP